MENPRGSAVGRRRRRIKRKKMEPSLSIDSFHLLVLLDDIIIDILSRLTAKDVLVCRCVCRKLRDLTSITDFTDLHSRRCLPMMLKDYHGDLSLLDKCWEISRTKAKIHKVCIQYGSCYKFSQNGLIVADTSHYSIYNVYLESFKIFNPLFHHTVKIMVPSRHPKSVYGVFFHPDLKEHCTLWRMILAFKPLKVQYRILNLESNQQWRDIENPSNLNPRIGGIRPVLIDKFVYWMVEPNCLTFNCEILEYDIRNESCRVIPCPVSVTDKENVNLIDLDGVVSVVEIVPRKELVEIRIWTLKYHRGILWTSCQYNVSSDVYQVEDLPKAVAFRNNELIFESDGRLYVCNLKLGTFRKFGQKYVEPYITFLSHVTSIVSLRNCKSEICMTEGDVKIEIESSCSEDIQAL